MLVSLCLFVSYSRGATHYKQRPLQKFPKLTKVIVFKCSATLYLHHVNRVVSVYRFFKGVSLGRS